MRKYEALIVLNMKGVTSMDDLIQSVADQLKEEGAQITEIKNIGRREFAYESNHIKAGQYVLYTFNAEPSVIRAARERLAIDEQVHYQYYRSC
ncbi:30S ribosomal protein S6 [Akkermansia glycaniphila]|uniref:Small ribosomal subunit protein bS6 n=1 Tax=Akkermansia glycaniphila TaxID=1679444 RepID=A0A1C7PAR0_9BACT|nr:30S ribosomal protein S6 [Akkermansia glycaniphila]MBT9450047.1 30S ribosomal protein S6 [Akkermansia glycaniphila]OCA02676.1 hypothetical protein AC781_09390 [Akkermansia glycaniphila]SEH77387.1 ribosomal protein s6 [Akkermansia glycaniphila]